MRVGILTFHSSCNFGANLQALSSQLAFEKLGVDPVIIDYLDEKKDEVYKQTIAPKQYAAHHEFCNSHLRMSPRFTTNEEIRDYCCDELDAVFVGSDAVFRAAAKMDPRRLWKRLKGKSDSLKFTSSEELSPYFLPWQRGSSAVKKFSIAASCTATPFHLLGLSKIKQLNRCFRDFDLLTVRDHWTQLMIRFVSAGRNSAKMCPDPVFALKKNLRSEHETWNGEDLSDTVLLSAINDSPWMEKFGEAAETHGLKTGNLPNPDRDFKFDFADKSIELPLTPLEWFSVIAKCRGFVGMRFHAMVSCLTNHTPVVSMDLGSRFHPTYKWGSKYRDLCRRAKIESRYLTRRQLLQTEPNRVLELLLDADSQANANEYADRAASLFEERLAEMLESI